MNPDTSPFQLPERLPVMPLRSTIVYPYGVIGLQVGMQATLEMLAAYPSDILTVALVVAPGAPDDPVDPQTLEKIGVACRLTDRLNLPNGTVQVTVQGIQRIRLTRVEQANGHLEARVEPVTEIPADDAAAGELIARILNSLEALAAEIERIPREVPRILRMNVGDPGRFADLVGTLANFSVSRKDEILQRLSIADRLTFVDEELDRKKRRVGKEC